jgi:hypothetical protein
MNPRIRPPIFRIRSEWHEFKAALGCFIAPKVEGRMALSRRDSTIVARHEVPGDSARPKEPSRRVRCDSRNLAFLKKHDAHFDEKYLWDFGCARSYRALRDGSFEGCFPRHFVPGYDRVVPTGRVGRHCSRL